MLNLTSSKTIKELLAMHCAKPSKLMGQNFLVHQPTLAKIIEAADLQPTDTVLEIGPGIGTLTQALAQKAKRVIAVEKDRAMIEILQETLRDCDNVEIIQGDALEAFTPLSSLRPTERVWPAQLAEATPWQSMPYKVVANIPYYLTSPLIRQFLESENPPTLMVLMVQKEVAQRICAKPPHMSILAVSVQFYAEAKIIATVSKEKFWPSPKVDSAIIKIIPRSSSLRPAERVWPAQLAEGGEAAAAASPLWQSSTFFKIVKAGFLHPRKKLINNLAEGLTKNKEAINKWLAHSNISPEQRAQTLSVQDWISLTNTFEVVS